MLDALNRYSNEVFKLQAAETTREETYYPAIKTLFAELLNSQKLPFEARSSTSERRAGGGTDLPDLALYDGSGDFVVALCEVKLPAVTIAKMATSIERNDQIGRYLAQDRVVILCNLRAFGLLTISPEFTGRGPVPVAHRRLEETVELWPAEAPASAKRTINSETAAKLADLIEAAVTRYAPIAEPESLARILAKQARRAKENLPAQFTDAVRTLLDDFGKALGISFEGTEGEEFFRSSLVQTVFYGLFAGWALWRHSKSKLEFRWQDLPKYLKIPFLGELIYELQHPQRLKELNLRQHLDIATETFARVNEEAFFKNFRLPGIHDTKDTSGRAATDSAIVYFYEPFLEAFDPDLRKELGVWYTPPEIVRYQVHKVDRILREELGCARGFADEKVVVLDPCCGTGAYLIEVLRYIATQLESEGTVALLGASLLQAFTHRIIGFEILTAPFVISQLQIYLILAELGSEPKNGDRLAIFLTNALTGWHGPDQLKLHFPELQAEHDAANKIKKDAKIIVVLGNPPYNRFAGAPMAEESDLVDHYKGIKRNDKGNQVGNSELFERWGIRKHLLDDLYIRFFRLAEQRIGERAEYGVISFISNSSYLAGRSHPIMRESLLQHFNKIWIDNVHGNRLASERTPSGESCETIFNTSTGSPGIKVGVSISTLIKTRTAKTDEASNEVFFRDFWGRAEKKRQALLDSPEMDNWTKAKKDETSNLSEGPRNYQHFVPTEENRWKLVPIAAQGGYEEWPGLDELFPFTVQGVNPNRGLHGSIIETDRDLLHKRMREYFSALPYVDFFKRHPGICEEYADYNPQKTRELLQRKGKFREDQILPYVLFPLDARWIYYETDGKLLNRPRPEMWDNLSRNEFLVSVPQPRRPSESLPLLASSLFDLHVHDRGSVGFPAVVKPKEDLFTSLRTTTHANLAPELWGTLKTKWNLKGDLYAPTAHKLARSLFRAVLGICHSPQYQLDHRNGLAQDWAHIPIPKDKTLMDVLGEAGEQIAILLNPVLNADHVIRGLLGNESKTLAVVQKRGGSPVQQSELLITFSYYGAAIGRWCARFPTEKEAQHPSWGDQTGDLFLNKEIYFCNVPKKIWQFELGGYPVLKKWLGYRDAKRGFNRPLRLDEAAHLRSMVQRIAALLVLHERLDQLYEQATSDCFSAEELQIR